MERCNNCNNQTGEDGRRLVAIVRGNDFTLEAHASVYDQDKGIYVPFDLSEAADVTISAVGRYTKAEGTAVAVSGNKVTARFSGALAEGLYGVEILFRDTAGRGRVFERDLFAVVESGSDSVGAAPSDSGRTVYVDIKARTLILGSAEEVMSDRAYDASWVMMSASSGDDVAEDDFDSLKEAIEASDKIVIKDQGRVFGTVVGFEEDASPSLGAVINLVCVVYNMSLRLYRIAPGRPVLTVTHPFSIDSELDEGSLSAVQNRVVKKALDGKVDRIDGKQLSTNDYTDADKQKVELAITGYRSLKGYAKLADVEEMITDAVIMTINTAV